MSEEDKKKKSKAERSIEAAGIKMEEINMGPTNKDSSLNDYWKARELKKKK